MRDRELGLLLLLLLTCGCCCLHVVVVCLHAVVVYMWLLFKCGSLHGVVYMWLLFTCGCCLHVVVVYMWLLFTCGCCLHVVVVWLFRCCCLFTVEPLIKDPCKGGNRGIKTSHLSIKDTFLGPNYYSCPLY